MISSNLFGSTRNFQISKIQANKVGSSTLISPKNVKSNKINIDTCQPLFSPSIALSSSFNNLNRKIKNTITFPKIIHSTPRFCFPNSKSKSIFRSTKSHRVLENQIKIFNHLPIKRRFKLDKITERDRKDYLNLQGIRSQRKTESNSNTINQTNTDFTQKPQLSSAFEEGILQIIDKMSQNKMVQRVVQYKLKKGMYSDPFVCNQAKKFVQTKNPSTKYKGITYPLHIAVGIENIDRIIQKVYENKTLIDSFFIKKEYNANSYKIVANMMESKSVFDNTAKKIK